MENTTPNSSIDLKKNNKPVSSKGQKIMLTLIILLFGFCGFLIWQIIQLKNVVAEKEIVYEMHEKMHLRRKRNKY